MNAVQWVAGVDGDAPAGLQPGWARAGATDRCNYHWRSRAIYAYAGTPMCERCVESIGGALQEDALQSGDAARAA